MIFITAIQNSTIGYGLYTSPSTTPTRISATEATLLNLSNDGTRELLVSYNDFALTSTKRIIKNSFLVNSWTLDTSSPYFSAEDVVAIQQDLLGGKIFSLQTPVLGTHPSGDSSSSEEEDYDTLFDQKSSVKRADLTGKNPATFPIFNGVTEFIPKFALDMKNDLSSPTLWISCAYDAKLVSFNRYTNQVVYSIQDSRIYFPTTLELDRSTGGLFVRCYHTTTKRESLAKIVNGAVSYLFEIAGGSLFSAAEDEYRTGGNPFLSSNSMKYDHLRKRLFWILNDKNTVYCLDENTMSVSSLWVTAPTDTLKALDVDLSSGDVYVLRVQAAGASSIARISEATMAYADECTLTGVTFAVDLVLGQNPVEAVLPFHSFGEANKTADVETLAFTSTGIAPVLQGSDISNDLLVLSNTGFSTVTDDSTRSFSTDPFHSINGDTGSPQAYVPSNPSVLKNVVNSMLWGNPHFGVKNVKVGVTQDMSLEEWHTVDSVIRLPRFSWQIASTENVEAMLIGHSSGQVSAVLFESRNLKIGEEIDIGSSSSSDLSLESGESEDESIGSIEVIDVLPPTGSTAITRIELDDAETTAYASTENGFTVLEARTLETKNVVFNENGATALTIGKQNEVWNSQQDGTTIFITTFADDYSYSSQQVPIYDEIVDAKWDTTINAAIVASSTKLYKVVGLVLPVTTTPFFALERHKISSISTTSSGKIVVLSSLPNATSLEKNARITVLESDHYKLTHFDFFGKAIKHFVLSTGENVGVVEQISTTGEGVSTYTYTLHGLDESDPAGIEGNYFEGLKQVVSVDLSKVDGSLIVVFATGEIGKWRPSATNHTAKVIHDMDIAASCSSKLFQIQQDDPELSVQRKARVYVGSKLWSNDRWDSGAITTTRQAMLYGGGDNLVPGQKYWVHVCVYTEDGWSSPQIQEFVMPRE